MWPAVRLIGVPRRASFACGYMATLVRIAYLVVRHIVHKHTSFACCGPQASNSSELHARRVIVSTDSVVFCTYAHVLELSSETPPVFC